jgi:hypothetical protein
VVRCDKEEKIRASNLHLMKAEHSSADSDHQCSCLPAEPAEPINGDGCDLTMSIKIRHVPNL